MIWGYHYFWNHPYSYTIYIQCLFCRIHIPSPLKDRSASCWQNPPLFKWLHFWPILGWISCLQHLKQLNKMKSYENPCFHTKKHHKIGKSPCNLTWNPHPFNVNQLRFPAEPGIQVPKGFRLPGSTLEDFFWGKPWYTYIYIYYSYTYIVKVSPAH